MTDALELLRRLRPDAGGPDPELVRRERAALLAGLEQAASEGSSRRRRKFWTVPGTVVVVSVLAAAGWAVLSGDPAVSTEISCPDRTIIDATSGDPVADCADHWRQQIRTEPPPLAGYVNERGGIQVILADEAAPEGWEPLEDGFRQDERLIALEAELDDVSRGLPSSCYPQHEAVDLVEHQLARLALTDWTVTTERGAADGTATCSTYYRDVESDRVVVVPTEHLNDDDSEEPFTMLAERLTALMVGPDAECLTLDEATLRAQREAEAFGFDQSYGEIVFNIVPSPDGDSRDTCARPTTNVGGRVDVTLRAVPDGR